MPLRNPRARRLMGMALAVKRGETPLRDIPASVRQDVATLARDTSEDELGKLASKPRTKAVMRS